jgi:hypothetical protein
VYGSDRIAPANGDFYVWAFGGSVTLPAARYDYNSDWTPLLAGLAPAGMAASLAAPEVDEARLVWMKREPIPSKTLAQYVQDPLGVA